MSECKVFLAMSGVKSGTDRVRERERERERGRREEKKRERGDKEGEREGQTLQTTKGRLISDCRKTFARSFIRVVNINTREPSAVVTVGPMKSKPSRSPRPVT